MSTVSSAGKSRSAENVRADQPLGDGAVDGDTELELELQASDPLARETGSNGEPVSLASRLFKPHTILSFVVALAIIAFFFRRLDINLGDVWFNIKHANWWYLAL